MATKSKAANHTTKLGPQFLGSMIVLYILLVYLLGVVLAVFFAKFYNKGCKYHFEKITAFGCLASWLLIAIGTISLIAEFFDKKVKPSIEKFINL